MGGGEGFVELVGERAVVAGFGDLVPRWWIRGEEGVAGAKLVEHFDKKIGDRNIGLHFPVLNLSVVSSSVWARHAHAKRRSRARRRGVRRACRRTGRGSRLRGGRPRVVDSRRGRCRGLFVVALAKKKREASRRGVHAAVNRRGDR